MKKDDMPTPVSTAGAPSAIGPYSQGIAAAGLLFVSGQIPLDPVTGECVAGDIEEKDPSMFEKYRRHRSSCRFLSGPSRQSDGLPGRFGELRPGQPGLRPVF